MWSIRALGKVWIPTDDFCFMDSSTFRECPSNTGMWVYHETFIWCTQQRLAVHTDVTTIMSLPWLIAYNSGITTHIPLEVRPRLVMSFLKGPLLVMAGMIIPLLLECETIVDPLLLGNTETMDHLLVLVYVTMMTIEEGLHHQHLNETGLLLPLILGAVILPRWTRLTVVMAPRRHPPMTATNGGQMKNIRQLMLTPPGQGHVPPRGQGKIMTESHPGNMSAYFFINPACSFWSTEITLNIVVLQRRRAMHLSILV